ncbi:MAG: DUF4129 domain-containing protein [Actinomycetota bacterium]
MTSRSIARFLAICCIASLVLLIPAASWAVDVSREELRRLVTEAAEDESSTADLERVTSVDGLPVDLGPVLSGGRRDVTRRLEALVAGSNEGRPDPAAVRVSAREILQEPRFRGADPPRPFAGLLQRLGRLFERPFEWIAERFRSLSGWGKASALATAGAILLAAGWGLARLVVRRRVNRYSPAYKTVPAQAPIGPERLENAADTAERQRDYALAVRLRFRAGLLRLAAKGVIEFRPSDTSLALRRTLSSPIFDHLAERFDAIVYGGEEATDQDVADARLEWRTLHQEIRA